MNEEREEPDHGVTVVFITLPNTKIELLYPLGQNSPITGFLEKNPAGGIHHMCYEVPDIIAARDKLLNAGARVLAWTKLQCGCPKDEIAVWTRLCACFWSNSAT